MRKTILYYLNGKPTTKEAITKRKAELSRKETVEHRFFEAPLTTEEKKEKEVAANNASDYFRKQREYREDLEARHG